jgi:hypothetical protein
MYDVRGKNGGSRKDGGGSGARGVPGKTTLVQKRYGELSQGAGAA